MQLRRAEGTMQDRGDDLESELPLRPEGAEEVEDDEGFGNGAEEGGGEGEAEEAGEEEVAGWVDAVEDDGDVGKEFADYVEGAWVLNVRLMYMYIVDLVLSERRQ